MNEFIFLIRTIFLNMDGDYVSDSCSIDSKVSHVYALNYVR